MIYNTLSQLKERHSVILTSYKNALPFYSQGRNKQLFRLLLFVAWCFVWFESAYRYLNLDYVYYNMKDPRLLIVPTLLIFSGIVIFKPFRLITQRTRFGKIEAIEKQGAYTLSKDEQGNVVTTKKLRRRTYDGTNIITVRTSKGKLISCNVPNLAKFDTLYNIDTSLSVIAGEKFPVPMDKSIIPDGMFFCTRCGAFERTEHKYCGSCHSLLWYK